MRVVIFVRALGSSGSGFRLFIISLPIRAKAEAVLEVKPFICFVSSHKTQVGCDSRTSPLSHYSGVTSDCTNWAKILLVHIKWFLRGGKKWSGDVRLHLRTEVFWCFLLGYCRNCIKKKDLGNGIIPESKQEEHDFSFQCRNLVLVGYSSSSSFTQSQ